MDTLLVKKLQQVIYPQCSVLIHQKQITTNHFAPKIQLFHQDELL